MPFREAEIAQKAARLQARTGHELALMEQNNKLRQAHLKAQADRVAARGKADADRVSSRGKSGSGMGADKGGSKSGAGGGSGMSRNGSGAAAPRRPAQPQSSRDSRAAGKDSARKPAGASGTGPGGKAGPKAPGGSHSGGRGAGGSNSGGRTGPQALGGKSPGSPASSPAVERARGRQERAAARQAARRERRGAGHAAALADRSKDRDQARERKQAGQETSRTAKAERAAARKAKREAAAAADPDRTTLGAAVTEGAQRRWDKRREAEKGKADKDGEAGGRKVDLSKDKDGKEGAKKESGKAAKGEPGKPAEPSSGADGDKPGAAAKDAKAKDAKGPGGKDEDASKDAPESPSGGSKGDAATDEPGGAAKATDGPSGGSEGKPSDTPDRPEEDGPSMRERVKERLRNAREKAKAKEKARAKAEAEQEGPAGTVRPEDVGLTAEWPDRETKKPPPRSDPDDTDYPTADIVEPRGLPRAAEPHTKRPGTTRPTGQESSVSNTEVKTASGQGGLAAQHRTDITFEAYLMEIANIAVAAAMDMDRAEALAGALGKVADALRDMATDLVGDHNVSTQVTELISGLADAAGRMKIQAERCATECGIAAESARLAAVSVARVYGEDMAAVQDAGLKYASAAAHHD